MYVVTDLVGECHHRNIDHSAQQYCKCKCFHQWAMGSVNIVLPHSVINGDLTDIN